jgi:endonuclease YncB( thermonuclease family)
MLRSRPVPLIQLAALILLLATGSAAALPLAEAAELRGTPQVLAGDLIQLQGRRLRLAGIDAPELGQRCALKARLYDCGEVARTALLDLTAGTEVRCRPLGPGPAGSTMARCFAAGYDLSEGMVYTGWALAEPAAAGRYGAVQEQAQSARRGLWRGRFVAPWAWSAGKRLPEENGG